MANPQKENGYTAIANELVEHLAMPGLNGSELRVIMVVLRKTYGFQRKSDKIPLSQFRKATRMNQAQVVRTIKSLVSKRILVHDENGYKLNKNWEQWVVSKRIRSIQLDTESSIQKDTETSIQLDTLKRKKERKEILRAPAKPDAPLPGGIKTGKPKREKKDPNEPQSLDQFIQDQRSSSQRHIQLIGEYADQIKPAFTTRGQWDVFRKQNLRAASDLAVFDDEQIARAFARIQENKKTAQNPRGYITKWTLYTLLDYIHE